MQKSPRYEVQTKYGWFSLDERSYQDYLAGRLWITWPPEDQQPKPKAEYVPMNVSEEAVRLRELANRIGVFETVESEYKGYAPLIPYTSRMTDYGIEEMNLSVRASNGLMRAGLNTFGRLYAALTQEGGIFKVRNLGAKSEREIRMVFTEECYLQMLPYEKAEYWQKFLDNRG